MGLRDGVELKDGLCHILCSALHFIPLRDLPRSTSTHFEVLRGDFRRLRGVTLGLLRGHFGVLQGASRTRAPTPIAGRHSAKKVLRGA